MNLIEFAEVIDAHIAIRTHAPGVVPRWYAEIENAEFPDTGMLRSVIGRGDTPDDALLSLAIQLKRVGRIVLNAYTKERREFNVPTLLEVY